MGLENAGEVDLTKTALGGTGPDLDGTDDDFTEEEGAGYSNVRGGEFEHEGTQAKAGDDAAAGNTGFTDDEPRDAKPPQGKDAAAAPQPPAATPAPSAPPAAKIGRWTEDEIAERFRALDSLQQGHQRVAGTVGDLRNRMMASGQPRKITPADLGKITEEFGPEYAQALAEDLNKIGFGGSQAPDEATIQRIVAERTQALVEQTERRFEKRLVTRAHRDADDFFINYDNDGQPVVGKHAHAFRAWVKSLPAAEGEAIANSWDADTMTDALDKFKAHQKAAADATQGQQGAPAGQEGQQAQQGTQGRQDRLRRAATPRGGAGGTPAEEDPFEAGYKSAKKGG